MRTPREAMTYLAQQMQSLREMFGEDFAQAFEQAGGPGDGQESTMSRLNLQVPVPPRGRPQPGVSGGRQPPGTPPAEIGLTPEDVVVAVLLPGLTGPEQVMIGLPSETELLLEAQLPPIQSEGIVLHKERYTGYVTRILKLPEPVANVPARAHYSDGVLELRLSRATPGPIQGAVSVLQVQHP